jgi:hypothetical protein
MTRPTFFEGVAVALAASLSGSILYSALVWAGAGGQALRLVIAGLGVAYCGYLLRRSRRRVGRITTAAAWLAAAGALWLLDPPATLYVLGHVALLWLVRSLYFHDGMLAALADLGLLGLGLAAAVWATTESGSLFLSLWSFFLVQALFSAIPAAGRPDAAPDAAGEEPFERAHRAAEAALRRLSSAS